MVDQSSKKYGSGSNQSVVNLKTAPEIDKLVHRSEVIQQKRTGNKINHQNKKLYCRVIVLIMKHRLHPKSGTDRLSGRLIEGQTVLNSIIK